MNYPHNLDHGCSYYSRWIRFQRHLQPLPLLHRSLPPVFTTIATTHALRYLPLVLQSHFISFVHLDAFWDKCYLIDIHFNLVGLLFLLYFDYAHEKDFYLFDVILHLASLATTTLTSAAVRNFNNHNYHLYDCHFDGHVTQVLPQRLFLPSCTQFGQPLLHQRRHRHCGLQLSQRTTCTVSINNFDNLIQSHRLSQSTTACATLSTATA